MQFATSAPSSSNPVSPGKFKKTVSQESPQSVREFTKQIEVRDQTECKETFKAIQSANTAAAKNDILDQALEYFMQKAVEEEKQYHSKLKSLSNTKEEIAAFAQEKEVRANEKRRWARKTDTNQVEFVSLNPAFNTYKSTLAKAANTAYPFTAEQLKSGSYWLPNVNVADPNEAAFACERFELKEDTSAQKLEERFSEVSVSTVAESLRELVHSEQGEFETSVDGVCAWGEGLPALEFTDTDKEVFESFWTPKGNGAFDTSLDEKRAAVANCWRYQPRTDIITSDALTKKQALLVKQREARGPLSEQRIARRIAKMTKYFNKPENYPAASAPAASFFQERLEVLSQSDMPAILSRHREYEDNYVNALAAKGAELVVEKDVWAVQKSFSFKSEKAQALKDAQMKKRTELRVATMAALKEELGL
eukprot:g8401.t1